MAQKRRNGNEADDMTGREKKKLKMSVARTIATQPGPSSQSRPIPTNTMAGMPSAIDIEKFVEARAFEIDAMHTAMKTASSTSTHRAWQTLPRHLRRRAASHDVRRVPLRLREKARAEMDPARKKALGRAMPKRGKNKHVTRTESLLKRQRDKMWLETHIWHAKRMHMKRMWGYSLAISPTEKAYRPSHRASMHDSILHDASYYSLAEIKGPEKVLVAMLEMSCDPQGPGPGSKRCLGGSRTLETHLYKPDSYPFDLIGPITIIWQPLHQLLPEKATSNVKSGKSRKTKKSQDVLPASCRTDPMTTRAVWLQFHPSAQLEVFDSLRRAASLTLAKYKASPGALQEATLEIADLKRHVNVFEIMGPKSSQVIKGALSPVASENREEFLKFWASLMNLQTAGSLPRGMIIGFKVNDPRLKFPPKNAKPKIDSSSSINFTLPSALLASSDIWDDTIRNGLAKPRFKKKDLDSRRSKNDIPGTPLSALRQDDRIPVLLIQRSLEASSSSDSQAIHGWTLIVPAGWSMAFFNSLVFTNTRIGGQRERQTQAYEAGTMYYPRDYPYTRAYDAYALDRESTDKSAWEKKPPAKRVNFEALGTRSPWRADWEVVLGIPTEDEEQVDPDPAAFVTTQRETVSVLNVARPEIKPWLLRGSEVPKILSNIFSVFNHGATLLLEINRLRLKRGQAPLSNDVKSTDLLKGALINVKISLYSRGAPQDLAAVYSLSDAIYKKWEKALFLRASGGISSEDDTPQESELSEIVPSPDSIIGYVTTGHYSLARGVGFAIGAVSLVQLIELEQQSLRLHPNQKSRMKMLACFRNPDSHHCRAAHIEVVLDA